MPVSQTTSPKLSPRSGARSVGCLVLALALGYIGFGAPIAAEVLVLRSGEQLQTKGPYQVRGSRIIYTSSRGDLLSIRASEVDLEATAALEARGAESEESAGAMSSSSKAGETRVVATITNRDVGTAPPSATSRAAAPASESESTPAASTDSSSSAAPASYVLVVTESRERIGTQGYDLDGTVANQGNATAVQIRVNATLVDVDGNPVEAGTVALSGVRLEPGESAPFSISLNSAPAFDTVRYDIASVPLKRRPPENSESGNGAPFGDAGSDPAAASVDASGAPAPPPRIR